MLLIYEDQKKRTIKNQEEITFSSSSAYHLIVLTARAKSEKQLGKNETDDEDLTVQIDNKTFPKLGTTRQFDSPASINGGRLHNLSKTVYFVIYLSGKDHKITIKADDPPGTATFESLEIYTVTPADTLILEPKIQAEDGDRREWITFVLNKIPLHNVVITITYSRRKRDSDDVKIRIDGQTQGNILRDIKHFLWYFAGSLIPFIHPTKTESQTFMTNFSPGLHYIEIDADRMPILEKVILNFGSQLSIPKRIPTVDDPKWTENFADDTEEILMARLILGEAENQPREAKIGVGYTVLNRMKKQNSNWGLSIKEIILKNNQYDGMWNEYTFQKVRDPLSNTSENRLLQWRESFEVAAGILSGRLSDTTSGATNFHSFKDPKDFPSWSTEETYRTKWGNIYFYELEK